MENKTNYFVELNSIDVGDKVEKKNGLTYLSWAYAWGELKKRHPTAFYTIYENADGWNYHTDGRTAWVKTGVTVEGLEHIEYLPVMDFKNASIPIDRVTSFDVNKAIQRSLTKAVARHGIGLYIYAGEDIPEGAENVQSAPKPKTNKTTPKAAAKPSQPKPQPQAVPPAPQGEDSDAIEEIIDYRLELRNYITQNKLDGHKVAKRCDLGPKSTPDDYRIALAFLRDMPVEALEVLK